MPDSEDVELDDPEDVLPEEDSLPEDGGPVLLPVLLEPDDKLLSLTSELAEDDEPDPDDVLLPVDEPWDVDEGVEDVPL